MKKYILVLFLLLLGNNIYAMIRILYNSLIPDDSVMVVFWNVENLFDIYDNPNKSDDDFTPHGQKRWTRYKYRKKLNDIAKTFIDIGGGDFPHIIAMAEIENKFVLRDLISLTPMSHGGYDIILRESHDRRGIDVALLYRKPFFIPERIMSIDIGVEGSFESRDILYVKGGVFGDTLHILVNHWPSKFGGVTASAHKRGHVAGRAGRVVDSLLNEIFMPPIIVTGDFNEVQTDPVFAVFNELKHLELKRRLAKGTIKYKGEWECIDHFFVSAALLNGAYFKIRSGSARIFDSPSLLEQDRAFLGVKPYRTYNGPGYNGGISDHLPIIVVLERY